MNPIPAALSHVTIGLDVVVQNLAMFPLLAPDGSEGTDDTESDGPLTLDEALSSGWAHVTELSESGSVPELRFVNKGARPVFILDGEELVGAKQNRVVNLSMLVPPASSLTIPVSCVESGRWQARSRTFSAAPRVQYAAGRACKMRQVTASMLNSGARCADQSAVWADISRKSARLHTSSETAAMEAMFVDHAATIDAFVEGLPPMPRQIGALFAIGGSIVGLDLFASAVLLRKLLSKIVRSYALDAIDPEGSRGARANGRRSRGTQGTARVAAEHFLEICAAGPAKTVPALGLGQDLRIDAPGIVGAALVHEERVVHLSAFAD
jgi:hypothetical protein